MRSLHKIALAIVGIGFAGATNAGDPVLGTIVARIMSCDKAVARAAIDEITRDPRALQEPTMLVYAAAGERTLGRKEEAAFWYYAARLRIGRKNVFEPNDSSSQFLGIMNMTALVDIQPLLQTDPALARRVVERVQRWDRATPDPFRDRKEAKSGEPAAKLAANDEGLRTLPEKLGQDPAMVAQSREILKAAERLEPEMYARRCGPGTLDPLDLEAAKSKIMADAQEMVKAHPLLLRHAGVVKDTNTSSYRNGPAGLPSRISVAVRPPAGKGYYAEVDVNASITADRKLGAVKLTLVCLSHKGGFDPRQDNCDSDPEALRP